MKHLKAILPHVCIVLSLMFMVFLVLDDYNPMMNFLTNSGLLKTSKHVDNTG